MTEHTILGCQSSADLRIEFSVQFGECDFINHVQYLHKANQCLFKIITECDNTFLLKLYWKKKLPMFSPISLSLD